MRSSVYISRCSIFLGTIPTDPPITLDGVRSLGDPFNFSEWLEKHRDEINSKGKVEIFDGTKYQMQVTNIICFRYACSTVFFIFSRVWYFFFCSNLQVHMYGKGEHESSVDYTETLMWQWVSTNSSCI